MSKTRDTGYLANVIQVHDTGVRIMSGSEMLMEISSSGAVTITGELSGSDAANALLLSGTGSVGFTTTGSFNSFTASYNTASSSLSSRTTQIESVYATTGSNSFRATQSITGSLTVTGQIIAQTLNVQQVTSSIVYSSGSNVFGCDINSRQTFTGSFYQTGSFALFSNNVGIGSLAPSALLEVCRNQNSPTTINLTNACTGTSAHVNLQLGNSSGSNVAGLALFGGGYTNSNLYLADGLYVYNNRCRGGIVVATEQCTDIILATNSTERWRLYCNGSVLQKTGSYTIDSGVVGRAGIIISPEGTNCNSGFTNIQTFYGSIGYTSPLVLNRYGGNVGVGCTSPNKTFTVNGCIGMSTSYNWGVTNDNDPNWGFRVCASGGNYSTFVSYASDNTSDRRGGIYNTNGHWVAYGNCVGNFIIQCNVGIGTTTPLSTLVVNKDNNAGRGGEISIVNIAASSAGSEAALNFGFGGSTYNADNGNAQIKALLTGGVEITDMVFSSWNGSAWGEKMRISANGNVGIGVSCPTVPLHVAGTIYAQKQGGTNSTAGFQVRGAGGGPRIQTYGLDADSNAWMGLGTDMAGNPYEHSLYFSYGAGGYAGGGRQTFGWYDGTTYSAKMTILANGSIGAPTGTNIYNPSDARLKQNVTTITNGLNKVMGLNPVKFNWVENFSPDEQGKDMLGFIAQEVQNVVPEAVEGFSDGSALVVGETTVENPLRVNEKFIIPVLVKAIQELKAENDIFKSCLGIS